MQPNQSTLQPELVISTRKNRQRWIGCSQRLCRTTFMQATHPNRPYPRLVWLALVISLATAGPAALACGGGGAGSYRKPPRPDQAHQHATPSTSQPQPRGNTPVAVPGTTP